MMKTKQAFRKAKILPAPAMERPEEDVGPTDPEKRAIWKQLLQALQVDPKAFVQLIAENLVEDNDFKDRVLAKSRQHMLNEVAQHLCNNPELAKLPAKFVLTALNCDAQTLGQLYRAAQRIESHGFEGTVTADELKGVREQVVILEVMEAQRAAEEPEDKYMEDSMYATKATSVSKFI